MILLGILCGLYLIILFYFFKCWADFIFVKMYVWKFIFFAAFSYKDSTIHKGDALFLFIYFKIFFLLLFLVNKRKIGQIIIIIIISIIILVIKRKILFYFLFFYNSIVTMGEEDLNVGCYHLKHQEMLAELQNSWLFYYRIKYAEQW